MFCFYQVLSTLSDNTLADLLEKIAGLSIEKLSFTFEFKIVVYNPQINWYVVRLKWTFMSCSCSVIL